MKLSAIIAAIETIAPLSLQEKWDNSGLQVALPDGDGEIEAALVCLDVTEAVVEEAKERGCNLIISHHPLIFKPFRSLTGSTPQQHIAIAALRAGIAIYSTHTALDSARNGVSYAMADALGLTVTDVLQHTHLCRYILNITCPADKASDVRLALLDAGANACAFNTIDSEAIDSSDFDGVNLSVSARCNISVETDALGLPALRRAINGLCIDDISVNTINLDSHPTGYGLGVIATVPDNNPLTAGELLDLLHRTFGTPTIRTSAAFDANAPIRRVAMCGGAGGEFINDAFRHGADAYISGDIRYHDLADAAAMGQIVFDIGHFESEKCTKSILSAIISKKFPTFAVYNSDTDTNPVKYL